MRKGNIFLYYGEGKGKTTLAIGQGIRAIGEGLNVIMIQFLDYNNTKESIPLKKLEPDFKIFRFEKIRPNIDDITESCKKELQSELTTAFNFTKKILETGECDVLILDGITDTIKKGYLQESEVSEVLDKKPSYMDIILTGSNCYNSIVDKSDFIYTIRTEKNSYND